MINIFEYYSISNNGIFRLNINQTDIFYAYNT